jgi:hypothetical protein
MDGCVFYDRDAKKGAVPSELHPMTIEIVGRVTNNGDDDGATRSGGAATNALG